MANYEKMSFATNHATDHKPKIIFPHKFANNSAGTIKQGINNIPSHATNNLAQENIKIGVTGNKTWPQKPKKKFTHIRPHIPPVRIQQKPPHLANFCQTYAHGVG